MLNGLTQQLNQRGIRLISDVGGPDLGAADYGARATLSGSLRCSQCLWFAMGNKYGPVEFAELSASSTLGNGYVKAEQWRQLQAYEGLDSSRRARVALSETGSPTYWKHVGPNVASCATICDASVECGGFAHQLSHEWSCGVSDHSDCPGALAGPNGGGRCFSRLGRCAVPGTCYFWNASAGARDQYNTAPVIVDTEGVLQRRDFYWKGVGNPGSRPHLTNDALAGAQCAGSCQYFYRGPAKIVAERSPASFTLDVLSRNRSKFEGDAALEQALERKLLEANAHPRMREILLDFLDRWRRIGGTIFVAQPLYRPPVLCELGGKQCGHGALMLGPDDLNSSKLQAILGYNAGLRSSLPSTAAEALARGVVVHPPACVPGCVWGSCVRGACMCFLGVSGPACETITRVGQPNACTDSEAAIGANVAGIHDWSRSWAYVDVFKSARSWCHMLVNEYSCRSDLEPPLEIDPSNGGYPARLAPFQKACAMMLRDLSTHYLSGVYTVLYEGDGTLDFGLDTDYVRRVRPGLIEVDVTLTDSFNNGIYLCITRTNEDDPIRRIRMMTPGYAASGALQNAEPEFHPALLHTLRRFRHLRFMDWAKANEAGGGSPTGEWADRAKEGGSNAWHSYAVGAGVPYESMIRLSNMLGASPWITLPHNASNGFALQLARLLNATLRPDVGVTISLSNEMWHNGFVGGQHALLMGEVTGLGRVCWYSQRTIELAQVMRPVLRSGGSRSGVRFAVEAQASNVDSTSQVLACVANSTQIDAIALAPYFDGYDPAIADLSGLLDSYALAVNATLDNVAEHAQLIHRYGYQLVLYEGGPSGEGNRTAQDLSIAANRHPRMGTLIRQYYAGLKALGATMMMHFTSVGTQPFGLREATDQDPATVPKEEGLFAFMDEHATCDVDANLDVACASSDACSGSGHCLAPALRWGQRDSTECSCYFAYSGTQCRVFTPVVSGNCGYR